MPRRRYSGNGVKLDGLGVVEQVVAHQAHLDRELPGAHQQDGVGVGDQVRSVADAVRAQQEGIAHVLVRLVDLAAVDREADGSGSWRRILRNVSKNRSG